MKALRLINNHPVMQDLQSPEPAEEEALVRVMVAGVCSTDLELVKGYMGFSGTLGHEFVGIVEKCDSNPSLIGHRVVGEINAACGKCEMCSRGFQTHCYNRSVLGIQGRDGAFAEFLTLPAGNLHLVPDNVDDRSAVFTEPLAAALEIFEQDLLAGIDRILLIGDGRLAQLIARVVHKSGIKVDVFGKHQRKLDLIREFSDYIFKDSKPCEMYDCIVEASGSPSGFDLAVEMVKPRGRIILKSTFTKGFEYNPAPLVINEVSLVGSRCGPFKPALEMLAEGLPVKDLIDGEFRMADGLKAIETAAQHDKIKILIHTGEI